MASTTSFLHLIKFKSIFFSLEVELTRKSSLTKMTVVSADLDFDTNKALILLGLSSNFKVRH